jgi:2-phosphosulfolactate phosphatase
VERLVLPSPNGSTISSQLSELGVQVVGASLRNRRAVAAWLRRRASAATRFPTLAVIPCGERWPDSSLRPAIEDLWGAGALISSLVVEHGWQDLSPEASSAATAFDAIAHDVPRALHRCASGRELNDIGFGNDVDVAAELDQSTSVPVLTNGIYTRHEALDSS